MAYGVSTSAVLVASVSTALDIGCRFELVGVANGIRTRDTQIHNLVLCQLSYSHHDRAHGHREAAAERPRFYQRA